MDYLKIAILPLVEAKSAEAGLKEKGIDIRLDHNEQTCRRGCSVTVEMWAKEVDLPAIRDYFTANFLNSLEGHEVDLKQLDQVFDPSKEKAICPACGFEFSTDKSECPDCGLGMGV